MKDSLRYTIFNTKWGYFGLVAAESALLRTHLPAQSPEIVKLRLLQNLPTPKYEKTLFKKLQELITAYFEGTYVNFPKDLPIILAPEKGLCQSRLARYSQNICQSRTICHSRKSGNPRLSTRQKVAQAHILPKFTPFAVAVLTACKTIEFGKTATYAQLANMAGSPKAARAVGNVMAKNPLPLIIPCHRVLKTNGQLGGFSAPGGTKIKKKMLELEGRAVKR